MFNYLHIPYLLRGTRLLRFFYIEVPFADKVSRVVHKRCVIPGPVAGNPGLACRLVVFCISITYINFWNTVLQRVKPPVKR